MGQGGHLLIINDTDYDWNRIAQHSYQMEAWDFPKTINRHSYVKVYIEYEYKFIHSYEMDDSGDVTYSMGETNRNLTILVDYKNDIRKVFVNYNNFQTEEGNTTYLGWIHDGTMTFYLKNSNSTFSSTSKHWMKNQMSLIGEKPLQEICIVGSHDAGMSVFNGGIGFASKDNTITQTHNINGQLNRGARYFDIRPVITGGRFGTGHYSYIGGLGTWQGANGEYMSKIIEGVNSFTSDNNCRELIILNLSHTLNTDLGNNSYREFTTDEWLWLIEECKNLKYLYSCTPNVPLTAIPLNQILGSQPAVVVILNGENIPAQLPNGFYPSTALRLYDEYSGTNDVHKMKEDQIRKMNEYSSTRYFLLSWTLTQGTKEVIKGPSICKMAEDAIRELPSLPQSCTSKVYPNILYTDIISYPLQAYIAQLINTKALSENVPATTNDSSYSYPTQILQVESNDENDYSASLPEKFWTKVCLSITGENKPQTYEVTIMQNNSCTPVYQGKIDIEGTEKKHIEFSPNSQCEITVNVKMENKGEDDKISFGKLELESKFKNMLSKSVSWSDRTGGTSRIDNLFLDSLDSNVPWSYCEVKIKSQEFSDITGVMIALFTNGEWYYTNHPEQWKVLYGKSSPPPYSYRIDKNTPLCAIGYITNHMLVGCGADITLTGYYEAEV